MPASLSQVSFATAVLASAVGSYFALTPPNPGPETSPSTGDSMRRFLLANKQFPRLALAPTVLLALHTATLAYLYPRIPPFILRHGAENGINTNLVTWSAYTAIPLALIICAGVPLRLVSYSSLGKNFTFELAEPDRLMTGGIYHYVQHPSYTGLVTLIVCHAALLGRLDGVLSCWIPPRVHRVVRRFEWTVVFPLALTALLFAVWARVRDEERMLRAEFGVEWEEWHARTARFIPGVI